VVGGSLRLAGGSATSRRHKGRLPEAVPAGLTAMPPCQQHPMLYVQHMYREAFARVA